MSDEQLTFTMPARPRRHPPTLDTSTRAQAKAEPYCVQLRTRIFEAVEVSMTNDRRRGLTATELAEVLGENVMNVRRRLSELHRRELRLRDSGVRRPNADQNPEVVWVPR